MAHFNQLFTADFTACPQSFTIINPQHSHFIHAMVITSIQFQTVPPSSDGKTNTKLKPKIWK